ncbi:hypothetical protein [Methylobacterium sp. E-046]|uniref:hypothetical protein n=1 Tax=Methylobacterium sp. E-046 TaxID=2836576 RepID=UPI001FBB6BBB|nr:hypothetical protein [Methylobacterium sp. E-046]MCJ2098627.1 hypothetical protein [Methylobacterium sp. E-046]
MSDKATHVRRSRCELRARELADYMAASAQRRRTVLRDAKYRPVARVLQHTEARATITTWLQEGEGDTSALRDRAEWFRSRMTTGDFEAYQNQHNADYVDAFAEACAELEIPPCEMRAATGKQTVDLNGTIIVHNPDLLLRRITKRNTIKTGALYLRYAKGKEMNADAAKFQSAFVFGFLSGLPPEAESGPEKKLCLTVCAYSGKATEAPTNSVYLYNEMKAACAAIADQWPNIEPPANAVL